MVPLNVILREQLNVKQRQRISETPAKGGGGLVENLLLVTWPDGRLAGQATLARLLPSGQCAHRAGLPTILMFRSRYLLALPTLRLLARQHLPKTWE